MMEYKVNKKGRTIDRETYLKVEPNEKGIYEINTTDLKVFVFDSDNNSYGDFIRLKVEATDVEDAKNIAYKWDKENHCNCCGMWYFELIGAEEVKDE